MTYNTLHMVNLLIRDVILVNLGFHIAINVFPCSFLFLTLQIHIGRIYLDLANCHRANRPDTEETPLGASSISCVFSHSLLRSPLTIEVLFTGYSHCRSHNNHRLTRLNLKTEEICWGGSALEESSTWLRRLFQQHLECYKINCIRTQGQYYARLDSNYLKNTKWSSWNTNKTHNALWVIHLAHWLGFVTGSPIIK